ncbi:TPA: ash family protein [Escherichia coli]|uniref:ash family protein n=1 Tax=Enterobacteriaceae TaxID=543 RepID=UPI0014851A87|nr:ash family protein [Escherichia coli]EMA7290937.1 ash family protein [Shigella sonnei]HBN3194800.1 ash family protein [Escherichia coli O25b:H4-ST131]EID9328103.1 ash family protein [Escherichia coli]EID9904876.1 ash family protein [Escherichia coli]
MSFQIIDVCVVLTVKLFRCGKSRSRDSQPRNPNDAQHAPACFCVYKPAHIRIMVAQAGQPKGWPVSFGPVLRTPLGLPPYRDSQLWW